MFGKKPVVANIGSLQLQIEHLKLEVDKKGAELKRSAATDLSALKTSLDDLKQNVIPII